MKQHITLRLSHDVLQPVEALAKAQRRSVAFVIEEILKDHLAAAKPVVTPEMDARIKESLSEKPASGNVWHIEADAEGRYRLCRHGKNAWTCHMTSCKVETNRV